MISNSVKIERKHKQIKKQFELVKRTQNGCNKRRKQFSGNSFHLGVNFEETLEDEAASSQEFWEEDLNNIVEERNILYNVL